MTNPRAAEKIRSLAKMILPQPTVWLSILAVLCPRQRNKVHLLVPTSLLFIQIPSPVFAVIAMVFFGMGIGVITVSYGFVTNLYFRAEVYGRAKSISAALRMIGVAVGPSLGGWLFTQQREDFMTIMVALALLSTASFALLLALKPTNSIHQQP